MKKIYAYYQSLPSANEQEEKSCANWWKYSWQKNGWEPSMLNRTHAQSSNLYNKLQQKLMNVAVAIPPELMHWVGWINARFVRWAALHAAGGGWMSDYDVVNLRFSDEVAQLREDDGRTYIVGGPAYLFYATKQQCEDAIKAFISEPLIMSVGTESVVRNEYSIINEESDKAGIISHVFHAKGAIERRSEAMKELCEFL